MKKFLIILLAYSLSAGQAIAADTANKQNDWQVQESAAEQRVKIGVAASVQGNVRIRGIVKSGMEIYLNDRVITGSNGSLQIMLLDETVFTLGPNSDMVIDKFVYDPSNDNGQVGSKITKGVFRFITGKIARKDPSKMNVNIKGGNIGIRGTIVAGSTGPDGSTVILAGPGVRNNAGERPGAVYVSGIRDNPRPGNEDPNGYFLNVPGEGTNVSPDGIVEKPRMMTDELTHLNTVLDSKDRKDSEDKGKTEIYEDTEPQEKEENRSNSSDSSDGRASADSDDRQNSDINGQSGQNDADTQSNASDTQELGNSVSDIQSAITQTTQEETVSKTAENLQNPVYYADLPNLGLGRAEYLAETSITGTKDDGTSLTRGITLKTVFNFMDRYFQSLYVGVLSEDRSTEHAYYEGSYISAEDYLADDGLAKFKLAETMQNNSTYYDSELNGVYEDFTAELQFFKPYSNNLPAIAADITVNTSTDIAFKGSTQMAGSLYTGSLTPNEMSALASGGLASAIYSVNGSISANEGNPSGEPYSSIGVNFLAKADFSSQSVSDMVLTLTPDSDADTNGSVTYYSETAVSLADAASGADYKETDAVSVSDALLGNKISGLKNSSLSLDLETAKVSMRNYYSPLLYIDSISAKVSTGTSGGYKYSGNDIEGYIPSRYHDRLTLNEFSTIANELNASGIPLAKYSLDSANMLRSDGDSSSGITMANFSTIVDFENSLVKNTSFEIEIPGNTAKEKISQTEAVPITGLFDTNNFSASVFSGAAAYTTDNLNASAGALLSSSEETLSDDSSGLYNITAGIYMSKPSGTSSLPGIEFFLDFLKDNSHYGTYDSSGNIDPLSLAGSIYAGDLTARYTALGTLHISENSSAYGASLVSRINITQKRYTEAFAALYSRNDSNVSQNYYNADGGSLADAIRLTPLSTDSEWPAYLNATATMDDSKTANNKFYDDNDTEVTLDVPSISVALSAPDGTATTEAQLYTMYNLDKTFDISTIQLPAGKKATWESSNYLTTNIDGKKPIYDILGASVKLSLDNTNNTLKLDASYNVQLTQESNAQAAEFTTQVTNAIMDNIPTTFGSSSSHTANVRFIDAGGSPDLIVNLQLQGNYEGTVAHTGFTLTD